MRKTISLFAAATLAFACAARAASLQSWNDTNIFKSPLFNPASSLTNIFTASDSGTLAVGSGSVWTWDTNYVGGEDSDHVFVPGFLGAMTRTISRGTNLWALTGGTLAPSVAQTTLRGTNIQSHDNLTAMGGFTFNLGTNIVMPPGSNTVPVANAISRYSYIWLTSDANTTDPTLRTAYLGVPTVRGGWLVVENYTNGIIAQSAFQMTNQAPLVGALLPWQTLTLINGDWKPTRGGESLLLQTDGRGWREVARWWGAAGTVQTNLLAIINPTDLYHPYRQGSNQFADSYIVRLANEEYVTNASLRVAHQGTFNDDGGAGQTFTTYGQNKNSAFQVLDDYAQLEYNIQAIIGTNDPTATHGLSLYNYAMSDPSVAYEAENSLSLNWLGSAWSTNQALSHLTRWSAWGKGVAAAADPTTTWVLESQIAALAPTTNLTVSSETDFAMIASGTGEASLIFGPGQSNALFRSVSDLYYTNGADYVYFYLRTGDATSGRFGAGGNLAIVQGTAAASLIGAGSGEVRWRGTDFVPVSDATRDLGYPLFATGAYPWRNLFLTGTNQIIAYNDGSTLTNTVALDTSMAGTKAVFNLRSLTNGVNGPISGYEFQSNGVPLFTITGTGGPSSGANWVASGATDSTLAGTASVNKFVGTNGISAGVGSALTTSTNLVNFGSNAGDSSSLGSGTYDVYNIGAGAGSSATYEPSTLTYGVFSIGVTAGQNQVLSNVLNVINIGRDTGNGQILRDGSTVINIGSTAGGLQTLSNTVDVVNIGRETGYGQNLVNSSDIFSIGNSTRVDGTNVSHIVVIGSNGKGTNSNDFVFGDSLYNYQFPGASTHFAGPVTNQSSVSIAGTLTASTTIKAAANLLETPELYYGAARVYRTALTPIDAGTQMDFALTNRSWTLSLTGAVSLTTANLLAGKCGNILITNAQATNCAFTFPAWIFIGYKPTYITAGKCARLDLESTATADAAVYAYYGEQQ